MIARRIEIAIQHNLQPLKNAHITEKDRYQGLSVYREFIILLNMLDQIIYSVNIHYFLFMITQVDEFKGSFKMGGTEVTNGGNYFQLTFCGAPILDLILITKWRLEHVLLQIHVMTSWYQLPVRVNSGHNNSQNIVYPRNDI